MSSRSPLRTESLLIAVLVTTVLSGCLSGPAPADAPAAVEAERAAVDPLQWMPSGPLRAALAPEPHTFLEAPASTSEAVRAWFPFPPLPLPTVAPVDPLDDALERFAAAHGTTVPEHRLHEVGLDPAHEAAMARLILTFLEAQQLQTQAVAGLSDEELAFLAGDPTVLDAWREQGGEPGLAAYETEAMSIVDRIDVTKNLQAADLLARAVEDLHRVLQDLPLPATSVPASHNHPVPPDQTDPDGDHTPDAVEGAIGTQPGNGNDGGGSAWDPTGDQNDVILRIPSLGGVGPGLLITGQGGTTIDEAPLLLIDLGGDDVYTAQGLAGARPAYVNNALLATDEAPQFTRALVSVVVDVGGNDDYTPDPLVNHVENDISSPDTNQWIKNIDLVRHANSLGGSVAGVGALFDLNGNDDYIGSALTSAFVEQGVENDYRATSILYGGMQGGGVFGGVGVLADLGGTENTFQIGLTTSAEEDLTNTNTPTAATIGASHGGGWLGGAGILIAMGPGTDHFHLDVRATTPNYGTGSLDNIEGATTVAAGQGGARSGIGILVDSFGDGTVWTNAGVAQGGSLTLYSEFALGRMYGGQVSGTNPVVPTTSTLPSVGFLFGSDGDSNYTAAHLAQAAAVGAHGDGTPQEDLWALYHQDPTRSLSTGNGIETFYAPSLALLLDSSGNDVYKVQPDTLGTPVWGVQGSAQLGAAAMLVDANGDDDYDARGADLAQGSGWLAQGLLVDQFGNDRYRAATRSQGFATDDPRTALSMGLCIGEPATQSRAYLDMVCAAEGFGPILTPTDPRNQILVPYDKGTNQFIAEVRAQLPTLGVLADRHGIDRYEAEYMESMPSQGAALGVLQHTVEAGFCHAHQIHTFSTGSPALQPFEFPLPPYLNVCDPRYPNRPFDDNRQYPGLESGRAPWQEPDTAGPPTHTFVLGLLMDTALEDTYVYGEEDCKSPKKWVDDETQAPPPNCNNWQWDQTTLPTRNLTGTRLPQENGFGVEPLDHPQVPDEASVALDDTQQVYGRGIDSDDLQQATGQVLGLTGVELVTLEVTVHPTSAALDDLPEGTDGVPIATESVYVKVRVTRNQPLETERVDVLASGILVDRDDEDGSAETYVFEWDTTRLDADLNADFLDGLYSLQATASVDLGAGYGPLSFESNKVEVRVNNPPIIIPVLTSPYSVSVGGTDVPAISPPLGHVAKLGLTVAADGQFPPSEPELATKYEGKDPGAYITIELEGTAGTYTLVDSAYYPAGVFPFPICRHDAPLADPADCPEFDPACDPPTADCAPGSILCDPDLGCPPDGLYTLRITAVDSGGVEAEKTLALLLDGTAPTSWLTLKPFSNAGDSQGSTILKVPFQFDNNPGGVDHVSAIEEVYVFRRGDDGSWARLGSASLVGSGGVALSDEPDVAGGRARFFTVAVDELGNTESPCVGQEQAPDCTKLKEDTVSGTRGPVATTIDFLPPTISAGGLESTQEYVKPGNVEDPVEFRATVEEEGTGIENVVIRFSGDPRAHEMELEQETEKGGIYVYRDWAFINEDRSAQEEPFIYTVTARDEAGNPGDQSKSGTLDAVAPTIDILTTRYADSGNTPRGAGGPGGFAEVRLDVRDVAVDRSGGVTADFRGVHPDMPVVKCTTDRDAFSLSVMSCRAVIHQDVEDGTYEVPVRALDVAGNVATAVATVVVSDVVVTLSDVEASAWGPDFIELSWTTDVPTTGRVYYGLNSDSLRSIVEEGSDPGTEHTVLIPDLSPARTYFLAAASENDAGTETRAPAIAVKTSSAVGLHFIGLEPGQVLSGEVDVRVHVELETAGEPATLTLFSRTERAGGLVSLQRLADADGPAGVVTIPLDTLLLGDGPVSLVVQGSRGSDVGSRTSPDLLVDNTAPTLVPVRPLPGMGVFAQQPVVDLLVFDASGGAPIDAGDVQVTVDGAKVTPRSATLSDGGLSRTLRVALPPLAPGTHALTVLLPDGAGNAAPPTGYDVVAGDDPQAEAGSVDYGAFTAASPGGVVGFAYDSPTPLDSVAVDASPLADVPLYLERGVFWSGAWTLPDDVPSGTYLLDVVVTDVQGQRERVPDALRLVVDADAPRPDASLVAGSPGTATATVSADEPVTVRVLHDDAVIARATGAARQHVIALKGLEPSSELTLDVVVVDGAGNEATIQRRVLQPDDQEPPTGVTALRARAEEGVVHLSWSPASDDVLVSAYRVQRSGWSQETQDLAVRDTEAPGGADLTYTVTAVDVVGNAGPPARVTVHVPEQIRLLGTSITPESGDETTPFDVRVELRHNLDGTPDVTLQVGGRPLRLSALDPVEDCRASCWYGTTTTLPATRLSTGAMDLHVRVGGAEADLAVAPTATVVESPDDAQSPIALALLPLLAALLLARRRSQ